MKKRYSEYVNYKYFANDSWFNPQVGWDTLLFIDPILIKKTKIKEFKNSYSKLVDFFSQAIVKNKSNISSKLIKNMFSFDEVEIANLGFSYDGNNGSGLKGKTAINVLNNLDKEKVSNSNRRGKRTIAKEKLYKRILNNIKNIYPNFNIGVSTSSRSDLTNNWKDSYRHWCFKSKNSSFDSSLTKKAK